MESEQDSQKSHRKFTFFNLTNERVIDLLSYSKYLYYIGIIETILYTVSVIGIPMIGFTLLATSFNDSPSIERVNIYVRWRYLITVLTLVIIVMLAIFTNWPKCTTQLIPSAIPEETGVWKTVCRSRGSPYALFFSLLCVVVVEIWAIYVAEMYRLRYKELQEEPNSSFCVCLQTSY